MQTIIHESLTDQGMMNSPAAARPTLSASLGCTSLLKTHTEFRCHSARPGPHEEKSFSKKQSENKPKNDVIITVTTIKVG